MSRPPFPDHVVDYITASLHAVDAGEPAPEPHALTAAEARAARRIIEDIAATPAITVDVPPLAEDQIAVRLGIVAPPAPVPVDTVAAVAALAGADIAGLADELARYDRVPTSGWLRRFARGDIDCACPITLRVLAALCGVPTLRAGTTSSQPASAAVRPQDPPVVSVPEPSPHR